MFPHVLKTIGFTLAFLVIHAAAAACGILIVIYAGVWGIVPIVAAYVAWIFMQVYRATGARVSSH